MNKFFACSVVAIALLGTAGAASATEINLGGVNQQTANVRWGDTDQVAVAADVHFDQISYSNITDNATNLVNTVSNKVDANQASGMFNGLGVNEQSLNLSVGPVDQIAAAVDGSGGGVNNSSLNTAATNSANLAANAVTITQH